jgi:hypothetical protein
MTRARYCLFQVSSKAESPAMHGADLLRDESLLLMDYGMHQTVPAGFVLATRIIPFVDFAMTAGAGIPVHPDALEALMKQFRQRGLQTYGDLREAFASRESAAELTALIIRTCRQYGAKFSMEYRDAPGAESPGAEFPLRRVSHRGLGLRSVRRVPRNAECPCGSGRRYKKCCGRR